MSRFLKKVETVALRLTGGSPGADKVAVSDADGEASWSKIVNANVDSAAAIAVGKLEAGSPSQLIVAGSSGAPEFAYLPIDVPIGTVIPYIFPNAPVGFLSLDGSTISRTGYADLFALANSNSLIGSVFGPGDGSTTFQLPDLRGRTPIGSGQGSGLTNRALGATGGTETHQLTTAEMPSHSHQQYFGWTSGSYALPYWDGNGSRAIYGGANGGATGGDGAHNNMQPFFAVHYIIKATYSTLLGDSHAEASEAFTMFIGGQ